jgi:hypothetical protein
LAICFHRIGYVNRRSGRSSALACGYITATKQTDARTGVTRDYRNKIANVTHTGHIAPDDAPSFAKSHDVWNILERHVDTVCEKLYKRPETIEHAKKTARVSQTHIFALPIELNSDDYHELAKRFINEHLKADKLVATYGIHEDPGNPHLHVQNALHQIDENGFIDTKYRVLYEKKTCKKFRYSFAEMCNELLAERGFTARVDPRSYEERGLDIEPGVHEGWYARKLAEEGEYSRLVEANKEIRERNKEKILLDTSIVLKELSQTHATFSAFEALSHVQKRTGDDPIHAAFVYEQVLKSAVIVGHNLEGAERYATAEYIEIEAAVLKQTGYLLTSHHKLSILPAMIHRTIDELMSSAARGNTFALNEEQQHAIHNLCDSTQLSVLIGRAGTGKTSSLKPVVELHTQAGFNVIGMALAAEAARHLGNDAGIESFTIASFEQRWKNIEKIQEALRTPNLDLKIRFDLEVKLKKLSQFDIQHNTLVIVDEAGMVGTESMRLIVKRVYEVGAKLFLIGDDRQFKAISAGDIFRKMVEESRLKNTLSTLTSVVRQHQVWMRNASTALSEFDTSTALDAYYNKGHIHSVSDKENVALHIADRYVEHVITHNNPNGIVITFTNEDCALLNTEIRTALQTHGKVGNENHILNGTAYAVNDKILFLQNQPRKAVNHFNDPILIAQKTGFITKTFHIKNGTKGTITNIIPIYASKHNEHPVDYRLIVTIEENGTTYEANFLNSAYHHFQHGYAITLYKAQGQTVDWSMVYATKHMHSIASYVAMTRHRKQLDIYYNLQEFPTLQAFYHNLNRLHTKDLVADYGLVKEKESINDIVQTYLHLGKEMTLALRSGDTHSYNDFKEDRTIFAKEILAHFENYGHVILQSGLTKANLEITAGLRSRTLSPIESKLLITLEQYIETALTCRDLWHTIRSTHPGVYSKNHPLYTEFQEKQLERGSLAYVLASDAPITRSFGKELYTGTGYGYSTIQKQASAFEKNQLSDEKMKHLSCDDQALVSLYKHAEQYQRYSAQLYQEHREIDKPLMKAQHEKGKVLFKTLVAKEKIQEKEKIDILTGGLCNALAHNPLHLEKLVRALKSVGIDCNKDALMRHATRYKRLQLIHTALQKDMPFEKELHQLLREYPSDALSLSPSLFGQKAAQTRLAQLSAARALAHQMKEEQKSGQKAITKAVILKEAGFEGLKAIYAAARHEQRIHIDPIFVKDSVQTEIYHLIAYSDAQTKANTLWGAVRVEAEHKNVSFAYTQSFAAYQQAVIERNCLAHDLLSNTTFTRLSQANTLLKADHLSIRLDRLECEAKEGFLHHACLTLKGAQVSSEQRQDAVDTLLTALSLDEQRVRVSSIMKMHQITQLRLHQHMISHNCASFLMYKDGIEHYYAAINGYKSAFRVFLSIHGNDWAKLNENTPEARTVIDATFQRNEAAFHLRPLIESHGHSQAFQQILEPLKITTDQLLHQGDCHESLTLARAFKNESNHTHKADLGYQLLERFVLETGTRSNRSVTYALNEEGLNLHALSSVVQSPIHLTAPNALNRALFDYKQTVIAFGKSYHVLMEEFKAVDNIYENNNQHENTKRYISHMASYPDFWNIRMNLAKIAYTIQQQSDDVAQFIPAHTLQKLGAYAHIHESYLLIQAYKYAKERHDPIAHNIAAEITETLAFEAYEGKANKEAPLAYGTTPALFHCEINRAQLLRDAEGVTAPRALRARDVLYLFKKEGVPSTEISNLITHTTRITATRITGKPHEKATSARIHKAAQRNDNEASASLFKRAHKQQKAPTIAPEEFKAFTRQVKQHLITHIEEIAVQLLGQPKEKSRNGIWSWPAGVRLHTRQSTSVPRGTFKIYAETTKNIDIFEMIKRTQGIQRQWDAVQRGAELCGLSFKPQEQQKPRKASKIVAHTPVSVAPVNPAKDEWTPLFPVPRDAEYVNIERHKGLSFKLNPPNGDKLHETMRFTYRNAKGQLLGYVIRLEDEHGKKQTLPLTYCQNDKGSAGWKWKGFGDNRPLYGLDRLAQHSDKPVLLVEGEKAADAAQKQFPNLVVMSWVGGSAGVNKIDLTPILNKTVIMWPDNDEPGFKAAHALHERFTQHAKENNQPNTFAIVDIPRDQLPAKWDLADALPETLTSKDIHSYIGHTLNTITHNVKEFHIEQEKEHTRHRTNDMYEKTFSFEEITQFTEKEGIFFLCERDRIPLILHTANETYKELTEWHNLNGEKHDFKNVKRQSMLTGLYTAWAHDRTAHKESTEAHEKAQMIGARAAKLHRDNLHRNDPHDILFNAEKSVADFEKQLNEHKTKNPTNELTSSIIEEEIWHASYQCQSLTGKAMPLELAKECGKHLGETYHGCEHSLHVNARLVRSTLKHMVTQKAQQQEIQPMTRDEATMIHVQQEAHKMQSLQQHQEHMKHLEQQRVIQQHHSREMEL